MDLNYEILQYYVYKRVIKHRQMKEIYEDCTRLNMHIESYMVAKGYCTQVTALAALGEFFCLPYCEMDMLEVDKSLLENVTFAFLRKHKFVPVSMDKSGKLLVAVARPLDLSAMSMISQVYVGPLDFILVPAVQIDVFIDSIVAVQSTTTALEDLQRAKDRDMVNAARDDLPPSVIDREDDVINNPSVRLVDSIIKEAIPFRASDIHIEPFEKTVKVRYRIDGDLQVRAEFPIESYPAICARLKILSGISIAERRIPQDGRISMVINGTDYDFRVSTLPTVHGEKFVIRILDKSAFNFTRSDLGFTEEENAVIDRILAHSYGIVLLTGPTGCGKTTVINLLMRFYDVDEGSIKVEDVDIREMTRRGLRAGYGMVLQDTWLKTGTIRDNITMGRPDATDEEVIAAAKASHIHSFIMRLPKGYDTWITEDGGGISQGQKQLLCIARVMLCRPPMLILDEATSSIDTRTEIKIQNAFAKLMEGRTTFIVAHRLSTIREADLILVMKDGKIIEQGNHAELLEQNGFYRYLYESQFSQATTA